MTGSNVSNSLPANQNHTVRFARKIYSVFCWIICTQVKEGKKLRLHKTDPKFKVKVWRTGQFHAPALLHEFHQEF